MKETNKMMPNLQLRRERERRNLSQEQLSQKIGTTALSISRWERGITSPGLHFRQKLTEFFGKSITDLGLTEEEIDGTEEQISPSSTDRDFIFPLSNQFVYDPAIPTPLTIPSLIGRQQLLQELEQQLRSRKNLAITGLPGVGKTTLVIELVNMREILEYFRDGVLWASLGPEPDISKIFRKWSSLLGITYEAMNNQVYIEEWTKAIRAAIGTRRLLLVIDSAWSIEDALAFKVGGPNCTHLLTTRCPEVALQFTEEDATAISELNEEEGVMLIAQFAPEVVASETDEVRALVKSVGGLPLALTLIGKYLRMHAHSGQPRRLRTAINRLHQVDELLQLAQPQAPVETFPGLPVGEQISLQTVISLSTQRLDKDANDVLYALSVFPPKPNSFSEAAALATSAKPVELLDTLTDAGLLEVCGPGRYTLHQIIVDYARLHLKDTNVEKRMVNYFADYVEIHHRDNDALEQEADNVLAALQIASKRGLQSDLVRGVNSFSYFLLTKGAYSQAETQLKLAEQAARSLNDKSGLTTILLNLGKIAEKRGDYFQAEAYYEQGLTVAREIEHSERISLLLANLGEVAIHHAKYEQAVAYLREGLDFARQVGHRSLVCYLLINWGKLHFRQQQFDSASAAFEEALQLAQGVNQELVASALYSLARVAFARGNFGEACRQGQESLNIFAASGHERADKVRQWLAELPEERSEEFFIERGE